MLFKAPIANFTRIFDGVSAEEVSDRGRSLGFLSNTKTGGYYSAVSSWNIWYAFCMEKLSKYIDIWKLSPHRTCSDNFFHYVGVALSLSLEMMYIFF